MLSSGLRPNSQQQPPANGAFPPGGPGGQLTCMPVKCYCSSNLPRQLSLHAGFGRGSLPGRSAPGGAAPPVNRPNSAGLLNDIVIAVSIIRMCIQTGSSDNRRLHFKTPCLHVAGPSVQAPGAPGISGFAPPMPVRTSSTGTPGAAYRPPAPGTGNIPPCTMVLPLFHQDTACPCNSSHNTMLEC